MRIASNRVATMWSGAIFFSTPSDLSIVSAAPDNPATKQPLVSLIAVVSNSSIAEAAVVSIWAAFVKP